MATEGERIAIVETLLREIRADQKEFVAEQKRTRQRVHELETTVRGLVMAGNNAANETHNRQLKIQGRLRLLTVVITLAAVVWPIALYFLTH